MKQLIADVRRYWDRRAIVAVRSLCRFGHVLKTAAGDSLVAVLGQALRRTDYRLVIVLWLRKRTRQRYWLRLSGLSSRGRGSGVIAMFALCLSGPARARPRAYSYRLRLSGLSSRAQRPGVIAMFALCSSDSGCARRRAFRCRPSLRPCLFAAKFFGVTALFTLCSVVFGRARRRVRLVCF